MKSDRQNLIKACAELRKLGYVVIWAPSTGCVEYDVPEHRAGFDVRWHKESRFEPGSFDDNGNLRGIIWVGWCAGELFDGDMVSSGRMWAAWRDAISAHCPGLMAIAGGPSEIYSLGVVRFR